MIFQPSDEAGYKIFFVEPLILRKNKSSQFLKPVFLICHRSHLFQIVKLIMYIHRFQILKLCNYFYLKIPPII